MKAQNRHDTKKWKKKRKNKPGDRCKNAKCGICSYRKHWGNSLKKLSKKDKSAIAAYIDDLHNPVYLVCYL